MNKTTSPNFTIRFCLWFTNCCLNTVEHPIYGKHQLTEQQFNESSAEYKIQIYKAILKSLDNGDLTQEKVKEIG